MRRTCVTTLTKDAGPRALAHGLGRSLQWLAAMVLLGMLPITAQAADLMWGVNGHPFAAYPGVPLTQQLDLVRDLGAKSYRVDISSVDAVPALADLVALARNRGVQILPVLTPVVDLERETAQVLYAKSFNFAVTLAARFKNDIRVWELSNELENYALLKPCELQDDGKVYPCTYGIAGGVGPLEYFGPRWQKVSAVLKGLSDGIVSVDPKLRKAIGTAGWGHYGAFDRMKQDGIAWDISVWHVYREEPEDSFKRLAAHKKPIWLTEVNHPQGSRDGAIVQAEGMRKIMQGIRNYQALYAIEAAFVYELLDEPYWTDSFEAVMGLVTQSKTAAGGWTPGDRKPAFETVRQSINAGRGVAPASCDLGRMAKADATAQAKVAYSYCLVLGREPDGQGMTDWSARLAKDLTAPALVQILLASDEFSNRYNPASMSNVEFVEMGFQVLVKRKVDAGGLVSYVEQLQSGAMERPNVLLGMVASDEFRVRHPLLFAATRQPAAKSAVVQ